jgi:DNA mismatch endonuclease (patch repair protein)
MERRLRSALVNGVFKTSPARSAAMAQVRSKGNRTTERRFRMALVRAGVCGWRLHPNDLPGKPDFIFPDSKVIVFVDGCFWHGCAKCGHIPKSNSEFWRRKLKSTMSRDAARTRALRARGFTVVRIWEHELSQNLALTVRHVASLTT